MSSSDTGRDTDCDCNPNGYPDCCPDAYGHADPNPKSYADPADPIPHPIASSDAYIDTEPA